MWRESVTRNSEDSGIPLEEWKKRSSMTSSSSGTSEGTLVPQSFSSSSEEEQSDNQQIVEAEIHHPPKRRVEFSGTDTQPSNSKATHEPKLSPAQSKPSISEVTNDINHSVDAKQSTSAATDDPKLVPVIPKTSPTEDEIRTLGSQPTEGLTQKPLENEKNKIKLHLAITCYEEILTLCRFLRGTLSQISRIASAEMLELPEESSDWEILKYGPDAAGEKAKNIVCKMGELGENLYHTDIDTLCRELEWVLPLTKDIIQICTKLENKVSVYKDNINTFSIFTPKRSKLKMRLEELLDELRHSIQNLRYYRGRLQGEVVGFPKSGNFREPKTPITVSIIKYTGAILLIAIIPAISVYLYFYNLNRGSPAVQVGGPSFNEQNSTVYQPNSADVYNTSVEEHDTWGNYTSTMGDIYSTILDIIVPTHGYLPMVGDYLPTLESSMSERNSTDQQH